MVDEVLEGEVGRSVTFEGKEYWAKEAEPIKLEDIWNLYDKLDQPYRPYFYYRYSYTKDPKFNLKGITEA